jgi:Resolvase, N terminal domain
VIHDRHWLCARKYQRQNLEIQVAGLKAAGCGVIRAEKRSGTTTSGRTELQTVLDFLDAGDVLMVTRIDRLARSIGDLQDIVRAVKAKGASLKATEQPIDTSTAAGKAFLDMLGVAMSELGLVSRASPVHTARRNCTGDEGGPFGFGDQAVDPKPPRAAVSKATVVSVAETSGR